MTARFPTAGRPPKPPSAGHVARHQPHRETVTRLPKPVEHLEIICKDGAVLRTVQAEVIGHFHKITTGFYLLKAASGKVFLQIENYVEDDFKAQELSRAESIRVWNLCTSKKSADALLTGL